MTKTIRTKRETVEINDKANQWRPIRVGFIHQCEYHFSQPICLVSRCYSIEVIGLLFPLLPDELKRLVYNNYSEEP